MRIEAPRAPLDIILRNLIDNAIKHHDRESGKIWITYRKAGSFVEFEVKDDGPGIPEDYHERIFQIFQTLKPRDEVEGSGIGLAIVKKLVDTYGGTIRLESEEGSGAAFFFTFPAKRFAGRAV